MGGVEKSGAEMARVVTQDIAIDRLRAAIGDGYDLSKAVYVDSKTKMTVICDKHGEFSRLPLVFWKGAGCHACNFKNRTDPSVVLERFRQAHGDRYDYSNVTYTHSAKPVIIVCRDHGSFLQSPATHWNGSNCPTCSKVAIRPHRLTTEKVLKRFAEAHGDRYDYSQTSYVNINATVDIICLRHGVFEQTPNAHMSGGGCPRCSSLISKPEARWADTIELVTGWTVYRQKRVKGVVGLVDMCLEESEFGKIAIEYDGCYWHSREGSLARDERKTLLLSDAGYKVVRLREQGKHHLDPVPSAFLNHAASQCPMESDVEALCEQLRASLTAK